MQDFLIPLHFTFMISGVVLILVAAALAVTKKQGWLPLHKTLGTVGAISAATGFASIFLFKYLLHYPHFSSLHSKSGLTVLIILVLVLILAVMAVSGKKIARPLHIWLGRLIAILLSLMIISGLDRFVDLFKR
ncbi:MAG: hypothetical protein WC527_02070 [Candidatus Margulisiibacteriota bacterium]